MAKSNININIVILKNSDTMCALIQKIMCYNEEWMYNNSIQYERKSTKNMYQSIVSIILKFFQSQQIGFGLVFWEPRTKITVNAI